MTNKLICKTKKRNKYLKKEKKNLKYLVIYTDL